MVKKYKESRIGKVPFEWKVVRFSDEVELIHGYQFRDYDFVESGIPIVKIANLKDGNDINMDNPTYVKKERIDVFNKFRLHQNDVLMALTGATLGKVSVIKKDYNLLLQNYRVGKFVPISDNTNIQYIAHLLRSNLFQKKMFSLINESAQPNVGKSDFNLIYIPLPTFQEQKKIADILSTVDEAIQIIKTQIEKTKELKRGLMQKLFSEGIGHTEFKDSKLGRIPKEWEVVKLQDVCGFITKGSTPTTYGFDWVESGVPFLRSECVGKNGFTEKGMMHISEEANDKLKRSQVLRNDILMTITGNVGRVCFYPFDAGNINQHIAIIRISSPDVNNSFALQYLSQKKVRDYYMRIITGAAYPQISLKQVRETYLPLPNVKEQSKIAEVLDNADSKLNVIKERLNGLKILKKGLMQKLLTGEKRVKINN